MNEGEVEKVIISVTPDTVKTKETARRNSTGKFSIKTSPSLSNSDVPHYLRASTGSCHDHCKYGTKHVFDIKKRNPNFRRYSVNNNIQREEQDKAKISTFRERRNSTKLEVKTIHPKEELLVLDIPDVVKQKVQKDIPHSDTNNNLEEESYEESESITLMAPSPFHESKISLDHRPDSEGEGLFYPLKNLEEESYEVSDSIKQMTPSSFHESITSLERKPSSESEGLSGRPISIRTVNLSPAHQLDMPDDPEAIELETPSPVEKNIISHVPTPLTWSEGSSDGFVGMELEVQSPTHTPLNQVEEISGESLGVESVTPVEINESDKPHRITASAPKRLKPKTSLATRKSVASVKLTPTGRAEKTSEGDSSVKLKGSSTIHQSSAGNKKLTGMESLIIVEGKKREAMKLKTDLVRGKTKVSDRDEASMEKKDGVTLKPKLAEAKIPSLVKGPITSISPRVIKKKVLSPIKSIEVPARSSLPPKLKTPMAKSTSAIISSPVNIKKKGLSPVKRIDAVAGSSPALKMKIPAVKSTPPLVLSERLPVRRSQGNKMIGSRYQSEPTQERVLKPSGASLAPKTAARGISSMKSTKYRGPTLSPSESGAKIGKLERISDKVKEPKPVKTVAKAIKTPKKNIRCSSSTSSSLTSSSPSSVSSHVKEDHEDDECRPIGANDSVFNDKETKRETPAKSLKSMKKQRLGSNTTVHTGDKQPSSHKLNFRRGKVVSPKAETNAPRKLRFRPRVVCENENGKEVMRRTLSFRVRRRASIGSIADLIAHKSEASSVVQRRQDVQEKKEAQGLLNHTDDKHQSPHKLSFLRGKEVSPKSENNSPRKLRFRARVVNESPSGKEVLRRRLRRRGSIGSAADLVTSSSEAPPVVLRHQGVQDKKEAQGLFNHVIEETASKLVETRKSKVKALVGAFETVISLQESSRTTPTS